MAITSQLLRPAGAVGEVLLTDWGGAGLPKPSLVKPVVATLEQALVLRKLGTLQQADLQSIRQAFQQIIG
jgi:mRNA interferase MazF